LRYGPSPHQSVRAPFPDPLGVEESFSREPTFRFIELQIERRHFLKGFGALGDCGHEVASEACEPPSFYFQLLGQVIEFPHLKSGAFKVNQLIDDSKFLRQLSIPDMKP